MGHQYREFLGRLHTSLKRFNGDKEIRLADKDSWMEILKKKEKSTYAENTYRKLMSLSGNYEFVYALYHILVMTGFDRHEAELFVEIQLFKNAKNLRYCIKKIKNKVALKALLGKVVRRLDVQLLLDPNIVGQETAIIDRYLLQYANENLRIIPSSAIQIEASKIFYSQPRLNPLYFRHFLSDSLGYCFFCMPISVPSNYVGFENPLEEIKKIIYHTIFILGNFTSKNFLIIESQNYFVNRKYYGKEKPFEDIGRAIVSEMKEEFDEEWMFGFVKCPRPKKELNDCCIVGISMLESYLSYGEWLNRWSRRQSFKQRKRMATYLESVRR